MHARWIRSQSSPFLAQQTGVLLEVWLRKQCLGEKEWHAFYFFSLMQLAQLFQRSSLFWTIIKNFSRAEEIKRKRFVGSHKRSKASCFTEFTQGSSLPSYFCSLAPPLAFKKKTHVFLSLISDLIYLGTEVLTQNLSHQKPYFPGNTLI